VAHHKFSSSSQAQASSSLICVHKGNGKNGGVEFWHVHWDYAACIHSALAIYKIFSAFYILERLSPAMSEAEVPLVGSLHLQRALCGGCNGLAPETTSCDKNSNFNSRSRSPHTPNPGKLGVFGQL
jgi:hypothetical protein